MATITYPHVGITTKALQRRTVAAATSTATTLLAPFMCDRGPDHELVAIDSMDQFIRTFGSLDYSKSSQRQILNIGKWLGAGGRVMACRLTTTADDIKSALFLAGTLSEDNKTESFKWAITKDGTVYQGSDSTISIAYVTVESHQILKIAYSGVTHYYGINESTTSEVSNSTNDYSNYGALAGKYTLVDTAENATYIKNVTAKVDLSSNHLILTNSVSGTVFDTGIEIMIPENFKSGTISLNQTGKASFSSEWSKDTHFIASAKAKYYGSYYNNVSVVMTTDGLKTNAITKVKSLYFDIVVYVLTNGVTKAVEKYSGISFDKLYTVGDNSEYITDITINYGTAENNTTEITSLSSILDTNTDEITSLANLGKLSLTMDTTASDGSDYIESILVSSLTTILSKPLETPFDVMLDCGYSKTVKDGLITLFCNKSTELTDVVRNDAFLYLTNTVITGTGRVKPTETIATDSLRPSNSQINGISCDFSNMAIMNHVSKTQDIYSADSGKEVFVPMTYYLAGLIPANDATNGVQWPVAGLTRGVISDSLWIDSLPTASEKQEYYDSQLNYVEKDDRGTCFMTQLTGTVDDTALKFINNSRSLLKMKRQLTLIGRQYLHEFNDRLTKANLLNALNTYLSDWIQNRTLSYGAITLTDSTEDNTLTDEEIEIGLSVKFTGTIEIISIDITVE